MTFSTCRVLLIDLHYTLLLLDRTLVVMNWLKVPVTLQIGLLLVKPSGKLKRRVEPVGYRLLRVKANW